MSLVEAKCTNCGSAIEVDSSRDAAICPICGSAFIVEKAITNIQNTVVNNYVVSDGSPSGVYEGEKKDGKRHGIGKCATPAGSSA